MRSRSPLGMLGIMAAIGAMGGAPISMPSRRSGYSVPGSPVKPCIGRWDDIARVGKGRRRKSSGDRRRARAKLVASGRIR